MIILLFLYLLREAFWSAASHALENAEEGLMEMLVPISPETKFR